MDNTLIFYIILAILIGEFLLTTVLNYLNAKRFKDPIPKGLEDVYNQEEYQKSQAYKMTNYRFGILTSIFSLLLILSFLIFGGFGWVDNTVVEITKNPILTGAIVLWDYHDW